jgi:hypothetical protein
VDDAQQEARRDEPDREQQEPHQVGVRLPHVSTSAAAAAHALRRRRAVVAPFWRAAEPSPSRLERHAALFDQALHLGIGNARIFAPVNPRSRSSFV